jgi:type IV pilus assembly protein PilP
MLWKFLRWPSLPCLCLALLFLNSGCEGKVTTKRTVSKPQPPAPVQPVALPPEAPKPAEVIKPFTYNSGGRRDPFQSIITFEKTKGIRRLLPLQRVELSELKLIAIVWGSFGRYAMVQAPDGKGYTLKVGTAVGPNDGSVKKITDKNVVIQENYTDIFGERKLRQVVLELHPQKEGAE